MDVEGNIMKEIIEALPGGPVVKVYASQYRVVGSIPGWGTEISHTFWFDQKEGKIE